MTTFSKVRSFGMVGAVVAGAAMIGQGELAPEATAEIGKKAPGFTLTDHAGETHSLKDFKGDVVVLEWFNPGCPFVVAHYDKKSTMNDLAKEFKDEGVTWLRVNTGKTSDAKSNTKAHENWGMDGAILLDTDSKVARMYGAKTTPHMYVIDSEGVLRYQGAIDDRRNPETNYVEDALKAVLAGETVAVSETRSYGCSVKYND